MIRDRKPNRKQAISRSKNPKAEKSDRLKQDYYKQSNQEYADSLLIEMLNTKCPVNKKEIETMSEVEKVIRTDRYLAETAAAALDDKNAFNPERIWDILVGLDKHMQFFPRGSYEDLEALSCYEKQEKYYEGNGEESYWFVPWDTDFEEEYRNFCSFCNCHCINRLYSVYNDEDYDEKEGYICIDCIEIFQDKIISRFNAVRATMRK